jgi:hypothetical protein
MEIICQYQVACVTPCEILPMSTVDQLELTATFMFDDITITNNGITFPIPSMTSHSLGLTSCSHVGTSMGAMGMWSSHVLPHRKWWSHWTRAPWASVGQRGHVGGAWVPFHLCHVISMPHHACVNITSSSSMCHVSIRTYHIINMSTPYRYYVICQQGHSCGEGVIMSTRSCAQLHPYTWSSAVEIAAPVHLMFCRG